MMTAANEIQKAQVQLAWIIFNIEKMLAEATEPADQLAPMKMTKASPQVRILPSGKPQGMQKGFIKKWRKTFDSDIHQMPPLYERLFDYLCLTANWEPRLMPTDKIPKMGLWVSAGMLVTSLDAIAQGISYLENRVRRTPHRETVQRILKWLEAHDMIDRTSDSQGTITFIKNWHIYQDNESADCDSTRDSTCDTVVTRPRQRSGSGADTTKEFKEVKKKFKEGKPKNTFSSDSHEIRLSELLLRLILCRKPDLKRPDLQSWAQDFDQVLRLDKRPVENVERLIRWVQADSFEQNNVLSPGKLRKRYDQLELKMQAANARGRTVSSYSPKAEPGKYAGIGVVVNND